MASVKAPCASKPKGRYCCVPDCHSNQARDRHLSFYRFPKANETQRLLWLRAVNRKNPDGSDWKVTSNTRICSAHFVQGKKSTASHHPGFVPAIFPGRGGGQTGADVTQTTNNQAMDGDCKPGLNSWMSCGSGSDWEKEFLADSNDEDGDFLDECNEELELDPNVKGEKTEEDESPWLVNSDQPPQVVFIFKRNHKNGKQYCCVHGCQTNALTSDGQKEAQIRFYALGKRDAFQKEEWIRAIDKANSSDWIHTKNPKICSVHFHNKRSSKVPEAINYVPTIFFKRNLTREIADAGKLNISEKNHKFGIKSEHEGSFEKEQTNSNVVSDFSTMSAFWHKSSHELTKTQPLLQKLWLDDDSKDMSIITSDNHVVKCHAVIFSLVSKFVNKLVHGLKDCDAMSIHIPDITSVTVIKFLRRVYCVDNTLDSDEDMSNTEELIDILKVKDVDKIKHSDGVFLEENPASFPRASSPDPNTVTLIRTLDAFDYEDLDHMGMPFDPMGSWNDLSKPLVDVGALGSEDNASDFLDNLKTENDIDDYDFEEEEIENDNSDGRVLFVSCHRCHQSTKAINVAQILAGNLKNKQVKPKYKCLNCKPSGELISDNDKEDDDVSHMPKEIKCPPNSLLCPHCGKKFSSNVKLQFHVNLHNGVTPFKCKMCDYKSHSMFLLRTHRIKCNKKMKNECQKTCDKCPEPDTTNHQRNHHEPHLMYSCKECPYRAKHQQTVDKHACNYHKEKGYTIKVEKIQCPKCPVMINKKKVKYHELHHHSDNLPHSCDECGYRALTQVSVEQHKGRYHCKEERFLCEAGCGQMFAKKMSMRWHVKRHCKFSTVKEAMLQRERELGLEAKRLKRQVKNKLKREELLESLNITDCL